MTQAGTFSGLPFDFDFALMATATAPSGPMPGEGSYSDQLDSNQQSTTLPLLQPMDLSQYDIYTTPLVSHSSLPPSKGRFHHTPSATTYSGSPRVQAPYLAQPSSNSAYSSPGQSWSTHGRSSSDTSMMYAPTSYAPTPLMMVQGETHLPFGLDQKPIEMGYDGSTNRGGWQGYGYAQPYSDYDMSHSSDGAMEDERKKTVYRERRHVCPVCDKRFNRPSSLNTHMTVHTGAKPFVCPRRDCLKAFSVSSNLRRHERTHGPGPVKARGRSQEPDDCDAKVSPHRHESAGSRPSPLAYTSSHLHSHSHSYSTGSSYAYAYPSTEPYGQFQPSHAHAYSYASMPSLGHSSAYSTTMAATNPAPAFNISPALPNSLGSATGGDFGSLGLDQYSINRRSSSATGEGDRRDSAADKGEGATPPRSPLELYASQVLKDMARG